MKTIANAMLNSKQPSVKQKRKKVWCKKCGGFDWEGNIHKCPMDKSK